MNQSDTQRDLVAGAVEEQKINSNRARRKRRRKRRIAYIILFALFSYAFVWVLQQRTTTTMIFVSHAEVARGTADPALTPGGKQRAQDLARFLQTVGVTAGVDLIYVTPGQANRQTAEPIAVEANATLAVTDLSDIDGFREQILDDHSGEIILVVSEGKEIEPLVAGFRGSPDIPAIAPDEHDNVYIVSIPWFGKEKTLRLTYGEPYRRYGRPDGVTADPSASKPSEGE